MEELLAEAEKCLRMCIAEILDIPYPFGREAALKSRKVAEKIERTLGGKMIEVWTDGSVFGSRGGWGVVCGQTCASGSAQDVTVGRMEVTAVLEGLRLTDPGDDVLIWSDSQYVVKSIAEGWAERWRANFWMKTRGGEAAHVDLWEEILELMDVRRVGAKWVKGHSGDVENELADALARRAAKGGWERKVESRPQENHPSGLGTSQVVWRAVGEKPKLEMDEKSRTWVLAALAKKGGGEKVIQVRELGYWWKKGFVGKESEWMSVPKGYEVVAWAPMPEVKND